MYQYQTYHEYSNALLKRTSKEKVNNLLKVNIPVVLKLGNINAWDGSPEGLVCAINKSGRFRILHRKSRASILLASGGLPRGFKNIRIAVFLVHCDMGIFAIITAILLMMGSILISQAERRSCTLDAHSAKYVALRNITGFENLTATRPYPPQATFVSFEQAPLPLVFLIPWFAQAECAKRGWAWLTVSGLTVVMFGFQVRKN